MQSQTQIALGLGSNLGGRRRNLTQAVACLCQTPQDAPLVIEPRLSPLYQSPALLAEGAPPDWNRPFLNMALTGYCALPPEDLLSRLQDIEQAVGKKKRGHWAPREIDIDLLIYGDHTCEGAALTLPHPAMTQRDFVLIPLAEIWPDWVHPELGFTVREMAARCGQSPMTRAGRISLGAQDAA